MKALSIKQPWASLIAHGIKNIENRGWRTNFRGRILIHTCAKSAGQMSQILTNEQYYCVKETGWRDGTYKPLSAIIGEVDIVDCVINHSSIWAEKSNPNNESILLPNPVYNWVLANPVLYANPILNVKGKLSFWDYELVENINH